MERIAHLLCKLLFKGHKVDNNTESVLKHRETRMVCCVYNYVSHMLFMLFSIDLPSWWADVFLWLPEEHFEKQVMKYSMFINALRKKSGLFSLECISLSLHHFVRISCMFKLPSSYHTLGIQTICRPRKYGLEKIKMCQDVYNNLLMLEEHIMLIPSLMEMCSHTCKIPLICILDHIAKAIMFTAWPATHLGFHPNCTPSSYLPDHVFKQTHSRGPPHVILPGGYALGEDNNAEVDARFEPLNELRWFLQEMVPLLKWFECWVSIYLGDPEKGLSSGNGPVESPEVVMMRILYGIMPMLGLSST